MGEAKRRNQSGRVERPAPPPKTLEQNFHDWEVSAIGYGYGSGEPHTMPALKTFLEAIGRGPGYGHAYDYEVLEAAVSPTVAWLFIAILCRSDMIEYGTSPRYGWLTEKGKRLKAFVESKAADELVEIACSFDENYCECYPDACNCGPEGYQAGVKCPNPFWI